MILREREMTTKEKLEGGKRMFKSFGPKEWIEYLESLNAEIPVDKLRLKLTDEEKKKYVRALGILKKERERIPGVSYEIKYSWFE